MPEPVGSTDQMDQSEHTTQEQPQKQAQPAKKKRFHLTHKQKVWLAIAIIAIATVLTYFYAPPEGDSDNVTGDPASIPTTVVTDQVTSQSLHHQVAFHGLQITVTGATIAQKFSDDMQPGGNYTLRINVSVDNTSSQAVGYPYAQTVRLVSSNGTSVRSKYISVKPDAMSGSTQTGWIDFPLQQPAPLSTFTLMLDSHTAIPLK